jgi:hypothetical protein
MRAGEEKLVPMKLNPVIRIIFVVLNIPVILKKPSVKEPLEVRVAPFPFKVSALLIVTVDDQIAVPPALSVIVSPSAALEMQVFTEV